MDVGLNWTGIGLATLVAVVLGSVWYSKLAFGNLWMQLSGMTEKRMKQLGPWPIVIAVVASFLMVFGMANAIYVSYVFFDETFLATSLQVAFWVWSSFSLTTLVMHYAFEGQHRELILLHSLYGLVLFMSVGMIIGLVGL